MSEYSSLVVHWILSPGDHGSHLVGGENCFPLNNSSVVICQSNLCQSLLYFVKIHSNLKPLLLYFISLRVLAKRYFVEGFYQFYMKYDADKV